MILRVELACGPVRGERSPLGGWRFLGIPFAAPPVGTRRWRAPAPVEPWNEELSATRFAPAPVQTPPAPDHLMSQFSFGTPPESGMDEDCLYLNVWAPDGIAAGGSAPLPVIFWIYGGGHRVGSASHPSTWGERLAARGAIVVAANYRVGALGYLAHPALTAESGSSGNYASLDLLAALRWVRDNIAAFGGDPQRVTLYGQSAGAAHANVLLASPLAQGLFHRAIVVSGGRMAGGPMGRLKPLGDAEAEGLELMARLGALTLEDMRSLPAAQIMQAHAMWNIVEDGLVSTGQPQQQFSSGAHHVVPVLAGFNANDSAPYPSPQWATVEGLAAFAATFGEGSQAFRDLYPATSDAEAWEQSYRLRRDIAFAYQPWRLARAMSDDRTGQPQRRAPSWLFMLDQAPPLPKDGHFHEPVPPQGYGAYHGADIWYAFGNFEAARFDWSDADRRVHALLADALVRFATDGQPGDVAGLPWPELDGQNQALLLSAKPEIAPLPNRAALQFFEEAFTGRGV